ncbi:protein C9orf135-like [Megalops cyprinoides]|uniref:protein C9orf135-like n=1 Tax=Megalops cyprinoides TaxID=118141 RepID=UPI0018650C84|nr:protein C9orf135-like [Megalops cyprinoides]
MHYSKATLVSNWHRTREAEPKDYDLTACPEGEKSLHRSTYKHFGTCTNTGWTTTTEDQLSHWNLQRQHEVMNTRRSMVQTDLFQSVVLDRETMRPKTGYNAVLPRHRTGHNQMDLRTTYGLDYLSPHVYSKKEIKVMQDQPDGAAMFRKRVSQFTDTADYHRSGRNTWQDESGVYGPREAGIQASQPTNPICQQSGAP